MASLDYRYYVFNHKHWTLLYKSLTYQQFLYLVLLLGVLIQILDGDIELWAAVISLLTQTGNLAICMYCPWVILQRLKRPKTKEQLQERRLNLGKILSRKAYFFSFVEHLVHELSIEV